MTAKFNPDKHHRQSLRLRTWDYTTSGGYFITLCTYQRENLFADVTLRELVEHTWQNIPQQPHAEQATLDEWVVMPNHLHGILMLAEIEPNDESDIKPNNHPSELPRSYPARGVKSSSVGAIIGNFKSLVTRRANNLWRTSGEKVWQRGYYDRIIRNERELTDIRQYIRDNPQRWEDDEENLDVVLAKMRLVTDK